MFSSSPKGMHALPVELLTRVFVLGAEVDEETPFLLRPDEKYYAMPSTVFQLTVSHVCHHWRHVALQTARLWTTLCFREPSHLPRAAAYLERCRRSPSRRLDIVVETVAGKEHVQGVTLCMAELCAVFELICPHVPFWRAFRLKIRDDTCKQVARKYLGNAPPAPNLQTLQLYHFEDFRVAQDLYIATYRRPVSIFSNSLPALRNVSLIGVNLPWDASPYLQNLHTLELALHSDHTRPPYVYWDRMLRLSPRLQRLFLHYSGPRAENGTEDLAWTTHDYSSSISTHAEDTVGKYNGKGKAKQACFDNQDKSRVLLDSLWELSLTDLDPDYLCRVLQRLLMPSLNKLSLYLPDQDFTPFVRLIAPPPPLLHFNEQQFTAATPVQNPVSAQLPPSGLDLAYSGSSPSSTEQSSNVWASSAQTPPETPSFSVHTSPASSSSSSSASLTSLIKPTLSSKSPLTTTAATPVSASGSSSITSTSRNTDIGSISINSFGSTSIASSSRLQTHSGYSLLHSAHSTSPPSASSSSTNTPCDWPLPRLSATLHTLIITALDCDFSAWRIFIATLEGVRNLEVFFHKIRFTGMQSRKCGGGHGDLAYAVLLDRVNVSCMVEHTVRTRIVLPLLERCKIAGLNGVCVKQLVTGRERGNISQQVEWLVAEHKDNPRDEELVDVFENGVYIVEEGKRVKVQRAMEDEDEDDEGESEVEDVNEVTQDYDASEETAEEDADFDAETSALIIPAAGGEEIEQSWSLAEQDTNRLDVQFSATNNNVHTTGTKYRASSVGGSSTSSGLASGNSDESFSSSSSSSTSSNSARKGRTRISDDHHG